MHRILPFTLVLLGLFSGFYQIGSIVGPGHLNFESLCQDGLVLSNQHTNASDATHFQSRCDDFGKRLSDRRRTSTIAGVCGVLVSLLLVIMGINFRVISKWYSNYI